VKEALGLAASYLERIGDSVNASIAYEAYVEADPQWESLVKAAKAYIRLYAKSKERRFLEKARQWLEEALLIRESQEVLYHLSIVSTLLGKLEEAERYLEGLEEEGLLEGLEVAIEERRRRWEAKGINRLKDPFLVRIYGYLIEEGVERSPEELERIYKDVVERNRFKLRDGESKVAALLYFALRGYTRKEVERFKRAVERGRVVLSRLPPFTRHLIRRFLHRAKKRPLPFYLKKDLERLNELGERLAKLEGNVHREYGRLMEEIKRGIKAFKRKASLVLPKEQIKSILKLYIATLPIEEEEKFNLLDLL